MARILIFDSAATVDSVGNAVDMTFLGRGSAFMRTKAVRGFGAPDGDGRNIAFEFALFGGTSGAYDVTWFMEFYNDKPSLDAQPATRDSGLPWAHEQSAEAAASGVVNHYDVYRTIQDMDTSGAGDVRTFPMVMQSLWTRLGLRSTAVSLAAVPPRLQIFALVGGYDSQAVLQAGAAPYAGV